LKHRRRGDATVYAGDVDVRFVLDAANTICRAFEPGIDVRFDLECAALLLSGQLFAGVTASFFWQTQVLGSKLDGALTAASGG
jgi:hypothetical protein